MPIDPDLLSKAKAAEARLIDAEHSADVARADFHHRVRHLQLAGASLREVAAALGLSHQRVHQIVEGAGGSRRWRSGRTEHLRHCTFCGKSQKQIKKLIAGPGIFICGTCIGSVETVLAGGDPISTPVATITAVSSEARGERCSFCGKRRYQVATMASAGVARICAECLCMCQEIVSMPVPMS